MEEEEEEEEGEEEEEDDNVEEAQELLDSLKENMEQNGGKSHQQWQSSQTAAFILHILYSSYTNNIEARVSTLTGEHCSKILAQQ